MHRIKSSLISAMAGIALIAPLAYGADWGSIKGRFVVDGTAPMPAPLVVNKDDFCMKNPPKNDSVVVGKDNALVNAVVYLRVPLGGKVEVSPSYDAALKKPVVLDNSGCSFKPHIVTATKGQKLEIKNSDPPPVSHNTNITLLAFNPIVPPGATTSVDISKDSPLPSPVACNIHTWMKAYLLALSHPYAAVSDQDGKFEIKDIPAGMHEFQFWHEAPGYLKNVKFKGGAADARGRAKITIKPGETVDLGDIKVSAGVLVPK